MTPSDAGSDDAATVEELARQAEEQAAASRARAEAARARADELRLQLGAGRTIPWHAVGAGAAATLSAGLLAVTGVMVWSHHKAGEQRHRDAEFVAAARQNVVNLMSIDYNTAQDSVQRVLDGSTGKFRANFEESAGDFVKAMQEEKITTTASVNDAAVESMTADSAVVLVSATSRREGANAPREQQQPRVFRMVLTMARDGGQIKISGVEFV